MLQKIIIDNIGPYEHAEVEFCTGRTAIIGENGSGKTTLLKCINMAIWGDSRYILDGNLDDFIRVGMDSGSVTLLFSRKGVEYRVKRKWSKSGRNSASLKTPRGTITGITNVTGEINRIFGIPTKNWLDIVWARQGSIGELLKGDKEVFDRLLGISDLENAWLRMREVTSNIKSDISTEEKVISELSKNIGNKDEIKDRIDKLGTSMSSMNDELKSITITNNIEDPSEEMKIIASEISKTELLVSQVENIPGAGGTCPTCGQTVTKAHIENMKRDNQENVNKLRDLQQQHDELEEKHRAYLQEEKSNRNKELRMTELKSDLRNAADTMQDLKSTLDRIYEINDNIKEHEITLDKLKMELDLAEKMRNGYRAAQPHLRKGRIIKLKYGVLNIFEEMFSGRFSYFNIDEDYNMTVWDGGVARHTYTLSGGESIALAIALRLSIVNEVGGQDLLILDEPTSHLDDDRIHQLVGVMDKIVTNDQIFLVTHDELLASVADNVIMITRGLTSSDIQVS